MSKPFVVVDLLHHFNCSLPICLRWGCVFFLGLIWIGPSRRQRQGNVDSWFQLWIILWSDNHKNYLIDWIVHGEKAIRNMNFIVCSSRTLRKSMRENPYKFVFRTKLFLADVYWCHRNWSTGQLVNSLTNFQISSNKRMQF